MRLNLLERFNHFFVEKQKLRYYIILVISFFTIGFSLAVLFSMSVMTYNPSTVNKTEILLGAYNNYTTYQIPQLSTSFLNLFIGNFRSAIMVLLLPGAMFLITIFFILKLKTIKSINHDFENGETIKFFKLFFKYMVLLISICYAFRSFILNNVYEYFSMIPLNIALQGQIHAIFEIPSMIIPSVISLYSIDMIYEIKQTSDREISKLLSRKLALDLLSAIIVIFILLIIAAYVESQITPNVFQHALGNYLFPN